MTSNGGQDFHRSQGIELQAKEELRRDASHYEELLTLKMA